MDRRSPALDGLRGIAIALVMLYHFTLSGPLTSSLSRLPIASFFVKLSLAGWTGVDLFFALSGFLITTILLRTKGEAGFFKSFYARRFLRIFPPYYFFLLGALVLLPWLPAVWSGRGMVWLWSYLTNWAIGSRGWNAISLPCQHFWTLAIEEQFYLVWPLIVFVSDRKTLARICVAAILAAFCFRFFCAFELNRPLLGYVSLFGRCDSLAAGAFLAVVAESGSQILSPSRLKATASICLLGLAGLFFLREGLPNEDPFVVTLAPTLLAGLSVALVAPFVLSSKASNRWLESPALRLLGFYSYSLYIFHQPVVVTLQAFGVGVGSSSYLWMFAAQYLVPFAATAALSTLSWYAVERPALQFKERLHFARLNARLSVE
jgi:peptidoglycan/LPS O-acetylase OafA/YrhL